MKRIMTLLLALSMLFTLLCADLAVNAATTLPTEELYFNFDGTEDYATWTGIGTGYLVENGMYRLVTDTTVATEGFRLPECENFTIEARIRYSNTAPRYHLYTKNNGIFIHMLYDGVYVENGKERLYSDKVEIGREWHDWKVRFLNDGNYFEIYLDGSLILEGETEHNGGNHPGTERYTIYKIGDLGEVYGIFEMDWRRYTPETNESNVNSGFELKTDKTQYTEGEEVVVQPTFVGEGMDNVYEVKTDNSWTLYAKQAGSETDWVKITTGTAAAHTNNKTLMVNCGLGVNSVIAYTKNTSGSVAYASGDTVLASFDADNSANLAKAYVNADESGNAGTVKTITCNGDTYAYASGGSGWLEIPFCPRYASTWGGNVYIQFRTHAITNDSNDKHAYFYFANTYRIPKNLNQELYQTADSSLTLIPDGGISASEINYYVDEKVVAVGKQENGYVATISGLRPGTHTVRAEYNGSFSKSLTLKILPEEKGELKLSADNTVATFEPGGQASDVKAVEFFVDGNLIATTDSSFSTALSLTEGATHTVSVIAKDENGIIKGKDYVTVYPYLSGNQTTTNYSNEVRYSVSGNSGTASVNVSNGTHKLALTHTKDGFTYLTDEGEQTFNCGIGDFIVVTDAYGADVYYNGMLVKSFTMPMTTDVTKTTSNNGLTIGNFAVTVPEERVTYFARENVNDAKTYAEVPYIPYSYVADMVMERNQNVRFYIKDGYFRTDVKIEDGKVFGIAKLRKAYLNDLGSYFEDAAPVWRMLGELPNVEGDMHIRVETLGGISRVYANDQQIGVFRGVVIAGGTGVAFDIEGGSAIKKFTISDASDVYYYEDEFDGAGVFSASDFWRSEGGSFNVDENSGKLTLDTTNAESGWATIDVAASKAETSADIQVNNGNGGFWYVFGKQDTLGGFVGYNFETGKFELGENIRGTIAIIAESDGTLPVGSTASWTVKTKRDKETDRELVELFIDGNLVISGYSTCHNNGNIGFASSGNSADIHNIKYRGNSKPVMGMSVYAGDLEGDFPRGFMTDEGTYFAIEGKSEYMFTDDGGKTFTKVSYDNAGAKLFDSFVRLDNGNLLAIDHGIYHPVSIEGGKAYQQHTYISEDNGMSWEFQSVIRPEEPYATGQANRAFKTSTGRIINACGDEYGVSGWTAEDYGAETIFYSDDNGVTWKTSDIVRSQEIGMVIAESVALERSDGSIRLFFRTGAGSVNYIDSHDNGATFDFSHVGSTPFEANVNNYNITKDPTDPKTWWAVWGYDWGYEGIPNSQWPRERFALAVSYDEGSSWKYVGTLKEMNYEHERYGNIRGNAMDAGIFVDDKAVYVRFNGTEEADNQSGANYVSYQFAVDKSKIVPTKSWEKLHFRSGSYQVEGVLDFVMSEEKVDKTLVVGTETNNLFMHKEFYADAAYSSNVQAEFAAEFVGADVNITGSTVTFTKDGIDEAFQGITANGKTYISTEEFAEKYDYKLSVKDGYKIISDYMGWRDTHEEVLLYTVADYVEPSLYDAVQKKNAWREILGEIEIAETAAKDYKDGDYVLGDFDAEKAEDLSQLSSSDGTAVQTTTFGDGVYAHATSGKWLSIPQILPILSEKESVYVKFRIHAIDNQTLGKVVYMYTKDSGNARASRTLNNAEIQSDRLLVNSASGVDVVFELKSDGHNNYVRTAGSDEEWTVLDETKEYSVNGTFQALQVQYGLGVSKAVVYKKVDAATSAFNAASKNNDVDAMKQALKTYETEYGIDLTKLDGVIDESAVYERLFNLNFAKSTEVAAVFDTAVTEQLEAEFNIDYVVGDNLISTFNASNEEDVAQLTSPDSAVQTTTFGGETYAHTSKATATSFLRVPQILPTLSEKESVFVKMRLHAAFDNTTSKTIYVWTENSGNARAGFNMLETVTNKADNCSPSAKGVDVILEMKSGGFNIYSKSADSDEWSLDYENKEYQARTGDNALYIYYGLAISDAKVYTKRTPATATLAKTNSTSEKWTFEVSTKAVVSSGVVYVGAYDENDILLGAVTEDFNVNGKTTVEMPVSAKGKVKYFKAFIWDGNLVPIAKSAKLDN